ncbi:Nif3-like dinuclear metal center hexameric protein [Isachenkonia alkalipeptolytica]|uniref:GTP cyclohydrolase 1 type 2 homolog n=1 Tax=Isachenkonia alkalipeptolytica TaxID=2565777 RepID=A0AA44BDN6_9CLOT|nr:Nif3-like dinuclear metal center hexameric protein [Isachenkonia alkalipeptolytica]NBG88499.1 Nif3-like dinuclear metal center hexameric protein [Isachenkonia alkalipeptolytica]
MSLKVKDIIKHMESIAPKSYAMAWDRVGLQIGSPEKEVQRIMVTLEINLEVLQEASERGVDLIISHHPLIFKALDEIDFESRKGAMIQRIIQEDIHIYVSHTNMDIAPEGLNEYIGEKIGLKNMDVISPLEIKPYCKFIVYVPETHREIVIEAIDKGGGGHIGNYSHCTFGTAGIGTFKPGEGSNPFLGKKDELERTEENKLETIVERKNIGKLLKEVEKVHPYEEVAYDLYPLEIPLGKVGLGRIGRLKQATSVESFIEYLKKVLKLKEVRYVGDLHREISTVAILNGSGGDFIQQANKAGADCFITGDLKYHEAQDAMDEEISILDIGHYESEIIFREFIKNQLKNRFKEEVEIYIAEDLKNPFKVL